MSRSWVHASPGEFAKVWRNDGRKCKNQAIEEYWDKKDAHQSPRKSAVRILTK